MGTVIKRKAHVVAQGYTQRLGINFNKIYSPVVRYNSIRCIIVVALYRKVVSKTIRFRPCGPCLSEWSI